MEDESENNWASESVRVQVGDTQWVKEERQLPRRGQDWMKKKAVGY